MDGPFQILVIYREDIVRFAVTSNKQRTRGYVFTSNTVDRVSIDGHDTGCSEVNNGRQDGSNNKKPTAADSVDKRQDDASGHEENDILDNRRSEGNIAILDDGSENCSL